MKIRNNKIILPVKYKPELDNWVTQLKSGKYLQGKGTLITETKSEDYFCCLGVYCHLYSENEDWYGEDLISETFKVPHAELFNEVLFRYEDVDRERNGTLSFQQMFSGLNDGMTSGIDADGELIRKLLKDELNFEIPENSLTFEEIAAFIENYIEYDQPTV